MSDTRTRAIHKAAAELVEELLRTIETPTQEKWFNIIVRKMEQVPPLAVEKSLPFRIGTYELCRLAGRISVTKIVRRHGYNRGGDDSFEIEHWEPRDIAKLRLWLDGK